MGLLKTAPKIFNWFAKNATKTTTHSTNFGKTIVNNFINDLKNPNIVRMAKSPIGSKIISTSRAFGHKLGSRIQSYRLGRTSAKLKKVQANANSSLSKRVKWGRRIGTMGGRLALGTTAMIGVGMMKGMMNQAREYTFDRYTQDFTYSRNMLSNSRLYKTMGNRMVNYNSTMGLSNALSRTRHGI